MNDTIECKGKVKLTCEWLDGRVEETWINNTVLKTGRRAVAKGLTNNIGDGFQYYINRMVFGDGGTVDGVKKYVDAARNGLFGVTRLSKPIVAAIDSTVPELAVFTSVIKFTDIVGVTINEMALQMANGELYSMLTFADFTKTEEQQLTLNWYLSFV